MAITGLHHITLVCADVRRTLAFYTGVLGLRLVKQTVNFDQPTTWHLYFGDAEGTPGSLVTFFEWARAAPGAPGVGGTHHFALTTETTNAQLKWKRRLTDQGVAVMGPYDRTYYRAIAFRDPDGCLVEIATRWPGMAEDEPEETLGTTYLAPPVELTPGHRDETAIATQTWPEPLPALQPDMVLSGLHHITAISGDIQRTATFWTEVLGWRLVKQTADYDNPARSQCYFGVGAGAPGTLISYIAAPPLQERHARLGHGQTHHFALCVETEADQVAWRERLLAAGQKVTPVLDRRYFRSIYFRDPDGHILEIATRPPGFTVDEPLDALGQQLMLPPWLEPDRATLVTALPPLA